MPEFAEDKERIAAVFKELTLRLEKVEEEILRLKTDKHVLEKENIRLQKVVNIQKNSIKEMERIARHQKMAALLTAKDKTAALHSLNKMVQEIDNCLTLVYTQLLKDK